ncbi:MAG TPA: hypothetical protein VLC46_16500 [Thermoanaerobaculia bacterium]|jgi:hypothetical protein|nr:hypothetical protein [Thermoanaerobaculia bacterium]
MAKSRLHYFRVMPGDEERMLRGVDVQAIGLHFRCRLVAFDAEPQGFLVDFKRRPLDLPKLADTFGMTNGRFMSIFNELRERQLIQSAAAYQESLRTLRTAWATRKVATLSDILRGFETPLDEIYVVPTMVDSFLDTEVGSKTGREGWDENGRRQKKTDTPTGDPIREPLEAPPIGAPNRPPHMAQKSEVIVRSQKSESPAGSERESFPSARTQGEAGGKPMTWAAYNVNCFKISAWTKSQPKTQSAEKFEAAFEAEFQWSWHQWSEIKRLMEASIPQPCQDGNHFFEGNFCRYCPFTRTGEEETA